jgi:hypothetical protein
MRDMQANDPRPTDPAPVPPATRPEASGLRAETQDGIDRVLGDVLLVYPDMPIQKAIEELSAQGW